MHNESDGMKSAIAVFVVLSFLALPISCLGSCAAMEPGDDCCPRSTSLAACPYDILSVAKATVEPLKQMVATAAVVPPHPVVFAPTGIVATANSPALDERDLHLQNRVFRI
jgi:hypothetical protein